MMLNTTDRFGLVAILLHWIVALTVLGLFVLGWYMVDLTYYDKLYNTLPAIHEGIGIFLIFVFIFRVFWKFINPAPRPVKGTSQFDIIAARIAHLGLSSLVALILISGYLIPTAEGSTISVFGWFEMPAIVTGIPEQGDIAGLFHKYLAYAIILLVLVHAAAALKHHLINKDDTLKRMMGRN